MPHFIVEYSANIESSVDMAQLCELIRATAVEIDTFPMPGIRVRAIRVDHYAIADGNADHAYIDVSVRLRGGRALDVRKAATQTLFDAVKAFLEPTLAERSLALSFEMRDVDPELSPKCGSIREHLPEN
ncbi:5-carboxymethyl-2-hydroxymuconate Delta-isomerase [Granulosicoccus sp.]|nr:5-carboxymethyl-2-hydroxymuconate Delta-isomerase [Granulosicoccus sp.]MDB4222134.1 5-carboxymethyl-2-hydroxymuconate Delta-isomerase [Granulosicoccus sp.]